MLQGGALQLVVTQGDSVIKVKSLPYDACQLDVLQFFDGFKIRPNGVQLVIQGNNKPSGEVNFAEELDISPHSDKLFTYWPLQLYFGFDSTCCGKANTMVLMLAPMLCRHLLILTMVQRLSVLLQLRIVKCLLKSLGTAMLGLSRQVISQAVLHMHFLIAMQLLQGSQLQLICTHLL